jgi:multiple sugar transport system substrate-binding protein
VKQGMSRAEFVAASGKAFVGSAMLLGLTGCGGGSESQSIRLRMTWWSEEDRQQKYNQILNLFERKNQNLEVSREYTPWDNYWDKFSTQVAGGNAPDVLLFNHQTAAEYLEKGVAADLEPFLSDGLIDLNDFDQPAIDGGKYEGTQYMVAMGNTASCILMNTRMLKEAGFTEALDPEWGWKWTWDDFQEMATKTSGSLGNQIYGTPDLGGEASPFDIWLRRNGNIMLKSNTELGFEHDDLAEWLDLWEGLRRSGGAPPGDVSAEVPADITQSLFATKQAVVGPAPVNQYPSHQALLGDDEVGLAKVPNGPSGAGEGDFLEAAYMAVYSQSDYQEEVARLINFWVNSPKAIKIDHAEQGAPAAADMREVLYPLLTATEQTFIDWIERFTKGAQGLQPLPTPYFDIEALLARTNESVAFGDVTIDKATEDFFNEAQGLMA